MAGGRSLPTFGLTEGAKFGLGYQEILPVSAPAAGQPVQFALSGGAAYRMLSLYTVFTTDAVAGNRGVALQVIDGDGNIVMSMPTFSSIPASTAKPLSFVLNFPTVATGSDGTFVSPLPDVLIPGGYTVKVAVSGIDPGDQFSVSHMLRERYPEGALGYPVGQNYISESSQ